MFQVRGAALCPTTYFSARFRAKTQTRRPGLCGSLRHLVSNAYWQTIRSYRRSWRQQLTNRRPHLLHREEMPCLRLSETKSGANLAAVPGFCCRSIRASVTGLEESIPFALSDRRGRASVRGRRRGRRLMGCVRIGRPIYKCVVALPRPGLRSDLIHRPGEGTSLRKGLVSWPARKPVLFSLDGRFCNGPRRVNPFCVIRSPGTCFCTGSAQRPPPDGVREDRPANLRMRGRAATSRIAV
jgi:hypothetical protein